MNDTPWTASSNNRMSEQEIEQFLALPLTARLATTRAEGRIHLTPVWFLYESGRFYITLGERRLHLRNLRRNPQATVLIDVDRRPQDGPDGDVRAVMCSGIAEIIDEADVTGRMAARLDQRYLAGSATTDSQLPTSPEIYRLIAITPTTLF